VLFFRITSPHLHLTPTPLLKERGRGEVEKGII